jgi:hypothetical protein
MPFDLSCSHKWVLPSVAPDVLREEKRHSLFLVRCGKCSSTKKFRGFELASYWEAHQELEQATEPYAAPPEPPVHDFRDKAQGWGGEYFLIDNDIEPITMMASFEGVSVGDRVLLSGGTRYTVMDMQQQSNSMWHAILRIDPER